MQKEKVAYLLLLIISFCGCDLFNTRTPERPDQPRSNYEVAVSPEILLQNFTYSLAEKNVQNYLNCFSDSSFSGKDYQFLPSAGSGSQYPVLLEGWSKKNEEQFFNNLISHISLDLPITFTKSNANLTFSGDNSRVYTASYFLNVPHNDVSIPQNYEGELQFNMVRDSRQVWTIFLWQDIKSSQNASWSELKGFYSPN